LAEDRSRKSREEIDRSMVELELPELDRNVGEPPFKMIRLSIAGP